MFISPMLARPLPKKEFFQPGTYAAEEKYDGFRMIVEVSDNAATLFVKKGVVGWSRYGNEQRLPGHMIEAFAAFPNCILDGEAYIPGLRSFGARTLVNAPNLRFAAFDLLMAQPIGPHNMVDFMPTTYDRRRDFLKVVIEGNTKPGSCIELAWSKNVETWEEVLELRDEVWARDGEGLILKARNSEYQMGKRSKHFIKIKDLKKKVVPLVGLTKSLGEINDRGPYGKMIFRDEDGVLIPVKTRNDADCRKFEEEGPMFREYEKWRIMNKDVAVVVNHPAIGRRYRIEYQELTPDGMYRHARVDRPYEEEDGDA